MEKLAKWIVNPFGCDVCYTLLVWILLGTMHLWYQVTVCDDFVYVIYLAMMYYVIAYLISLIVCSFGKLSNILKPISIITLSIPFAFNYICVKIFHNILSSDIFAIIKGTNMNETSEFIESFLSWQDLFCWVFLVVFPPFLYKLICKKMIIGIKKKWISLLFVFFFFSICAVIHNKGMIDAEFGAGSKTARWAFNSEQVVDLRNHLKYPIMVESDSLHPSTIIIMIGESFSKNHSSLYGYSKITNPRLTKLAEQGHLYLLNKVTSPTANTTATFKYLLNTHTLEDEASGIKWYDSTNFIEMIHCAGYHTVWISNQNELGMFDNLPSGHSKICDEKYFNQSESKNKYDEYLLSVNPKDFSNQYENICVFYHFMGQHETFSRRYPDRYRVFTEKDYKDSPGNQRKNLADYDNATLYNDYVVDSIIQMYSSKDAIFVYFSDHALDVYDTSSDYCGHARGDVESQKHCKEIPFLIYLSPSYREKNPSAISVVKKISSEKFCTDSLCFVLQDLIGWKMK